VCDPVSFTCGERGGKGRAEVIQICQLWTSHSVSKAEISVNVCVRLILSRLRARQGYVCVCACVWEKERERARACARERERERELTMSCRLPELRVVLRCLCIYESTFEFF